MRYLLSHALVADLENWASVGEAVWGDDLPRGITQSAIVTTHVYGDKIAALIS
jgi:hypothetical protein